MADDEGSSPIPRGKQTTQGRQRFRRFESVVGTEPQASLPNLIGREVRTGEEYQGREAIFIAVGPEKEHACPIPAKKLLSDLDIQDEQLEKLAKDFSITDFRLFRLVIAFAAFSGQKSKDYRVYCPKVGHSSADKPEYKLLCQIHDASKKLEDLLGAAVSRAANGRNETASLISRHPAGERLLEAVREYGVFSSRLKVTEVRLPPVRPERGEARRVVVTLARAWTKLTGHELEPYADRFYSLVNQVCRLVHVDPAPAANSVASWVKKELSDQQNPNNRVQSDE